MKYDHFLKMLGAAVFAMTSVSANAGSASGAINYIIVRPGLVYFQVNAANQGRPACAAGTNYYMIKDENSAYGKQQLALLLTAKSSGRTIVVEGAGQCTKYPDGEDVHSISIQ